MKKKSKTVNKKKRTHPFSGLPLSTGTGKTFPKPMEGKELSALIKALKKGRSKTPTSLLDSKPMEGIERELLSEAIKKSAKKEPTLPGRDKITTTIAGKPYKTQTGKSYKSWKVYDEDVRKHILKQVDKDRHIRQQTMLLNSTARGIAESIFYLPATNMASKGSIDVGEHWIKEYAAKTNGVPSFRQMELWVEINYPILLYPEYAACVQNFIQWLRDCKEKNDRT